MTVGERMRNRRKELGLSAEHVAEVLDVSPATIYRYENGDIEKLPVNLLAPIAKVLSSTPAYLMGWEDGLPPGARPMPTTVKKPRLGTIACGTPILAGENIEGYDEVPDWVKCDFTLLCKGDSMINARIYDGDIVCIKQQETAENGQIAAVMVEGDFDYEATLKRVKQFEDHIILEAENPTFRPLVYWYEDMNRVHIIGIATHFISRL